MQGCINGYARVHRGLCKDAPGSLQGCIKVSARLHRGLCKGAPRSLQGCIGVSARLHQGLCKVAPRSLQGHRSRPVRSQNGPFGGKTTLSRPKPAKSAPAEGFSGVSPLPAMVGRASSRAGPEKMAVRKDRLVGTLAPPGWSKSSGGRFKGNYPPIIAQPFKAGLNRN